LAHRIPALSNALVEAHIITLGKVLAAVALLPSCQQAAKNSWQNVIQGVQNPETMGKNLKV
jgi:hypothetical protein